MEQFKYAGSSKHCQIQSDLIKTFNLIFVLTIYDNYLVNNDPNIFKRLKNWIFFFPNTCIFIQSSPSIGYKFCQKSYVTYLNRTNSLSVNILSIQST